MTAPTTLILNHPKPFDALGENAQIVLGVLRDDGWSIERIENNQHLLLCAVPYLTKREEEVQTIRIQAMTAAYKAQKQIDDAARTAENRKGLRALRRSALALSLMPLLYGGYGVIFGKQDAFLTFFGGVVLLNSALGFLFQERRYV